MATLTFYGAAGTVTGSKYLLDTGQNQVLVDCGMFQGPKALRERNWAGTPFNVRSLDAIVLTHAHIDHTGYLPRVVAEGYDGPIYCSRATAELLRILLPDSARLQEEETDFRNRKGLTRHNPARPLYTEDDANRALRLLQPVGNQEEGKEVAPDVHARFYHAGHLLGARFVTLDIVGAGDDRAGRRILFSGDVGRMERPILWDPAPPPGCDYLLCESTYGDRLHMETDPRLDLARIINDAARRGGPVLIPAFAVGRTQELIYMIRELEDDNSIPVLPVRVDSPMASLATRTYLQCVDDQDDEYKTRMVERLQPLVTRSMQLVSSASDSKKLNEEKGARIIISASGMMTGGRVLHHALRILPDPNATMAFAGYQVEGTTGRRIMDGETEVKIMKQWTPVRCKVEKIASMSGHADWKGILEWLRQMPDAESSGPRVTYMTHGDTIPLAEMRRHIVERFKWNVEIPAHGQTVELN
jgi:metallo-beta-lactamase family protein